MLRILNKLIVSVWLGVMPTIAAVGLAGTAVAAEDIPYLLTAASKGDIETVRAMLNSGASPNTKDADGITALMYAARKGNAEVAAALIEKGAEINAKDSGGWTPLMFAAKKNYVDTVRVLLEKGADAKVRDESGSGRAVLLVNAHEAVANHKNLRVRAILV